MPTPKEISDGIINYLAQKAGLPIDDIERIAAERSQMCNACEHKTETLNIPRCGLCGCVLVFKQRSLSSTCPLKLWK